MKLLFDENLSSALPSALMGCYGECLHVRDIGLKASPDTDVWAYAERTGHVIVTKGFGFQAEKLSPRPSSKGHMDWSGQLFNEGNRITAAPAN